MSLWRCWTSHKTQRHLTLDSPTTAQPSLLGICGPFDTGLAGATDSKETSVKTNDFALDNLSTVDATELFDTTLGDKELLDPALEEDIFSLEGELGDNSFLEMYSDLSEYLMEGSASTLDAVPSTSPALNPRKRAAPSASTMVTTDHDYVMKPKRTRMSTSSVSESEGEVNVSLTKAQKYRMRRDKNNVASRRSRETRKQKFTGMEEKAMELEKKNEELREKVKEMEALAKTMKAELVKRLAGN